MIIVEIEIIILIVILVILVVVVAEVVTAEVVLTMFMMILLTVAIPYEQLRKHEYQLQGSSALRILDAPDFIYESLTCAAPQAKIPNPAC